MELNNITIANFNEIIRIIWACYKEAYFSESDNIRFKIINNFQEVIIENYESIQNFLYSNQVNIITSIFILKGNEQIPLNSANQILNFLIPYFKRHYPNVNYEQERWDNFITVSNQSVENESIAIKYKQEIDVTISNHKNMLDYIKNNNFAPNQTFYFFNQYASFFGRYDMPFSKMKLPLKNKDSMKYAPELGENIKIYLAAIKTENLNVFNSTKININDYFKEEFSDKFKQWEESLNTNNEYSVFPIHPLSINLFKDDLSQLIDSKTLVINENIYIETRASLSYRTMIPLKDNSSFVIKLPIPIQMTGYIRHIDWEEIIAGPRFSEFLGDLIKKEDNFNNTLNIDEDFLTACIKFDEANSDYKLKSQYFSFLLRENQSKNLNQGEMAMPLAALFSRGFDGKSVFSELISKQKLIKPSDIYDYFEYYSNLILNSVLSLYLRYGIMLEAHQENLGLIINKNGKIKSLHYHDIPHAVFIYKPIFKASGLNEEIIQDLPFVSDELNPSYSQLIHTTFQLNLLSIIELLVNDFYLDRKFLLEILKKQVKECIENEINLLNIKSEKYQEMKAFIYEIEYRLLKSETFLVKRLLGRMYAQSQTKSWGKVPNYDKEYLAVKGTQIPLKNPFYNLE